MTSLPGDLEPAGMTGNDDLGMNAWYVFSSLGRYPTMSGANFLAVSSPRFLSARVRMGTRTPTVTAPGASAAKRYIQRVTLAGATSAGPGVTRSDATVRPASAALPAGDAVTLT
jgi:putative alpha-1,2-mannosidase